MEEGPRQAFIGRVMENRPLTEIGREMGVSDVQAGRLYRRAVTDIQKQLGVTPGETE
jgi:DNA-directed RNA polymerase specialized sigma subunit